MKRKQKFASRGNLIAGLTLLAMLTGCGGGESKNRCETDSFLVVIGCFGLKILTRHGSSPAQQTPCWPFWRLKIYRKERV